MNKLKKVCRMLFFFICISFIVACSDEVAKNENTETSDKNTIISDETNIKKSDSYTINSKYLVNIKSEEIIVSELENEYTFLFLTDTHIAVKNENDSDQEKEFQKELPSFTNEYGITSEEAFPYWIEYANNKNINAVLMGGDIISYPTEGNVEFLKNELSNLEIPYVYTIGNHDWSFPWEYLTNEDNLDMLSDFSSHNMIEYDDLIILSLDTSTDQMTEESLNLFKEYCNLGKKIILILHVPISTESVAVQSTVDWGRNITIGYNGIYPNNITLEFLIMMNAEDCPVICVLGGHVHFYDYSLLDNNSIIQIVGDDGYGGNAILLQLKND